MQTSLPVGNHLMARIQNAKPSHLPLPPEIITDYETHGAARSDMGKTPDVLDRLESAELMPKVLFEDGGYPAVPSTIEILDRGVELMAPVNRGWLGDDTMGRNQFEFDEEGHVIKCPEGHPPINHRQLSNGSVGCTLHAVFNGKVCRECSWLSHLKSLLAVSNGVQGSQGYLCGIEIRDKCAQSKYGRTLMRHLRHEELQEMSDKVSRVPWEYS